MAGSPWYDIFSTPEKPLTQVSEEDLLRAMASSTKPGIRADSVIQRANAKDMALKASTPTPAAAPANPVVDPYIASLGSGDAPPTGASDAYGPSVLAMANEAYNSPEARKYLAGLEESQKAAIKNQKAGVTSAQGNLDNFLKLPAQYDLSPLMNLSDSWFGSNLQKGYKAPSSAQELIGTRSALEGALAKNRMGVTEAEKDRLQQNLTNRQKMIDTLTNAGIADAKRLEAKTAAGTRSDYKEAQQKLSAEKQFQTEYGKNVLGLAQMRSSLENMRNLISKNGRIPEIGSEEYNQFKSELSSALTTYNVEYAKLGALAGADLGLLNTRFGTSPSYLDTWLQEKFLNKSISKTLANMAKDADTAVSTLNARTKMYDKFIPDERKITFDAYEKAKGGREGSNSQGSSTSTLQGLNASLDAAEGKK